jgi:8-oxo-dGTP diphosphatase
VKEPIRKLNGHRSPHGPFQAVKAVRRVVAALMLRGEGAQRELFICQRRPDQPMGLKWEFPGGKIEAGETSEQALFRELQEELGIDAAIGEHITTIRHTYRNGGAIEIEFFLVRSYTNELVNRIFEQMRFTSSLV